MNTAACLLGVLTVLSPSPTLVADVSNANGRVITPTAFQSSCGVTIAIACRVVSSTRANWSVTAWAPDGQIFSLTTQRDSDAFPVALGSDPWPAAYRTLILQRTTLGPQWIEARATRADGCQTSMRVEVR